MNYIIFDLEATCWEHMPPGFVQETIEIGAYRLNQFGEIRGKFNRFVKPVVHPNLSPYCRQLTTISQQDVNRAQPFPEVILEFQDWAYINEETYALCSWGNFDRKLLLSDCLMHRIESDWVHHHVNLKEQYRLRKKLRTGIGLMKAVEMEGIEFTGIHHRGISDAENLTKLFLKYLAEWDL
jgi:inhibitor of KinA sporulation pathway (predicted exonuclease)